MALAGSPGGAGWTWRPVARDALLARAFHSCTELRGRFYLVGGLPAGGATEPSGDTVVFDPAGGQAVRLGPRGGPRRSHHDAAPVGGRWLCVVGGWDGSRRVATVAALDTERGAWEAWSAAPGSRPPAGLSSHTCTRVSDRELRVAGREGGTRTQRRYGSVYTLRLDPGARTYRYGTPGPAPSPVPSSVLWKSAGEQNRRHSGHSRTPAPASPPAPTVTTIASSLSAGATLSLSSDRCSVPASFPCLAPQKGAGERAVQRLYFPENPTQARTAAYPQL